MLCANYLPPPHARRSDAGRCAYYTLRAAVLLVAIAAGLLPLLLQRAGSSLLNAPSLPSQATEAAGAIEHTLSPRSPRQHSRRRASTSPAPARSLKAAEPLKKVPSNSALKSRPEQAAIKPSASQTGHKKKPRAPQQGRAWLPRAPQSLRKHHRVPERAAGPATKPASYALPRTSVTELEPWPLASVVDAVRERSAAVRLRSATGRKRRDLLSTIWGVLGFLRSHQTTNGAILDPGAREEVQYSTPCYALACAVMLTSNPRQPEPAGLRRSCVNALSHSINSLRHGACGGHCAFFGLPVMAAWRILSTSSLVSDETKQKWSMGLAAVNATLAYGVVGAMKGNWGESRGLLPGLPKRLPSQG